MPLETIEYRNCRIEVYPDFDPMNPRTELDNAGTMVCCSRRYRLGDERIRPGDISEYMETLEKDKAVWLPLYLYDHSGISISTRSFVGLTPHSEWDSGRVGIIFMRPDTAKAEGLETEEAVIKRLEAEVSVYDQYLRGEVYGFKAFDQNEIDSCWGFYGDTDRKSTRLNSSHYS